MKTANDGNLIIATICEVLGLRDISDRVRGVHTSQPFACNGTIAGPHGANIPIGVYGRIVGGAFDWEVSVGVRWLHNFDATTDNAVTIIEAIKGSKL